MALRDSWARIEAWLGENAPTIRKSLRPPAKESAIEKLQTKLRMTLPADFAASTEIHDGQKTDADHGLFPYADDILGDMPSFRLLSLTEIHREWKMMKELHDMGQFKNLKTEPGQGVGNDWWNTSWVPLADNGGGDYFCLDLVPGERGAIGQVIVFFHDMNERPLIARSYAAWLEKLAKGFASGKYILDEDEGIVQR